MPRGSTAGATAALIEAVAAHGVRVSPYQIERWRAAGELPRPVRHGRGRGRGTSSESPDEATVQQTVVLARTSRRGARRIGSHPIERLAQGRPVGDDDARRAIDESLAQVGRLLGADLGGGDEGWQARTDMARKARAVLPPQWGDLLDAVQDKPPRPEPSSDRVRAALIGFAQLFAGDDALPEDLIDFLGLAGVPDDATDEMRRQLREAELSGETHWTDVTAQLSLEAFRRTARSFDLDQWRRAILVFAQVKTYQMFVALLGAVDLAGSPVDLGGQLTIDADVAHRLRADPMWQIADVHTLIPTSRYRTHCMTLGALSIMIGNQTDAWETFLEKILALIHPPQE